MTPIIDVRGLSKAYRIGHRRAQYGTLTEAVVERIRHPRRRRIEFEQLWALDDVSFSVEPGEILGIIGRNGSGKSTLLKILSRIVSPTRGRAVLRGKVASLLEIGTGFHSELTGRENIFLNGALLGMRRRETRAKFDAIVDFAGIERFLDTPVKFYSSGMYVRLGFAVAAHLDPDVLVVDEVLAVGDADFQSRSLGKMRQATREEGRTVLFVSHNMAAVQSLCSRALVLEEGCVTSDTTPERAVMSYLSSGGEAVVAFDAGRDSARPFAFTRLELRDELGRPSTTFEAGEPLGVTVDFELREPRDDVQVALEIWNDEGVCVLTTTNFDHDSSGRRRVLQAGSYTASCVMPTEVLRDGRYHVTLASSRPNVEMLGLVENAAAFEVARGKSSVRSLNQDRRGVVEVVSAWEVLPAHASRSVTDAV